VIRGESLRIALKREIRKELGAEIDVTGFFMYPFSYDYSKDDDGFEAYFKLFPMLCTLQANNPDPSVSSGAAAAAWRIRGDGLSARRRSSVDTDSGTKRRSWGRSMDCL